MIRGRLGYTALLCLMLPYVLARLAWRALRQPAYLRHLPERFGYFRGDVPKGALLWIHAVSVGETRATVPIVRAVRERYPGVRILITHMTPTGREAGAELYGDGVLRCYLPYDFPGAIGRFLAHYRPAAGMLMETEIWPNLVYACRERCVPLYLVNARLSEKSAAGYRRIGRLARESFGQLTNVFAQTERDAERFAALGAKRVVVTGNVKFDVDPPADQIALGDRWRSDWGSRPVLLAASTRDGEEALLLDAAGTLPSDALLVIVPRHPQRFDEVEKLIERRSLPYQRRSRSAPVSNATRVLLGDSMGEMFAYYQACDIAYIGGTILPYGGQNLIEACALGRPVLLGPHTYNFSEASELALASGAAARVGDAVELMKTAGRLLEDRNALAGMGQAATAFSRAHRGATQDLLRHLHFDV